MQRRQVGDGSTSTANPELQMAQQQRSGNGGQWKKGLRIPLALSRRLRSPGNVRHILLTCKSGSGFIAKLNKLTIRLQPRT